VNGATWQTRVYHTLRDRHGLDRHAALAGMTRRYMTLMRRGDPVHTWPLEV
jgi:hypothetical protein